MSLGIPKRRTHNDVRHGTTSLFAALDVASGFVIGKRTKRHRTSEFLSVLKEIDGRYRSAGPAEQRCTSVYVTDCSEVVGFLDLIGLPAAMVSPHDGPGASGRG